MKCEAIDSECWCQQLPQIDLFLVPRLLTPVFATWSSYEGYLEGMRTSKGTSTDEPLYKAGAYLEGMRTSKGTSTDEPLYKAGAYLEGLRTSKGTSTDKPLY